MSRRKHQLSTRIIALVGAGMAAYFGLPVAQAKPKSTPRSVKKAIEPEVYSAVETDGAPQLPVVTPAPVAVAPIATTPPTPDQRFDPVPPSHADSIAKRLEIVAQLIREHGRAYDYRVLTTKELQKILASLSTQRIDKLSVPSTRPGRTLPAPKLLTPEILDES